MGMDVARYLAIVRRWWWLLLLGAMFSVAAYGVVTRLQLRTPAPPTYAASTTLSTTLPPPAESAVAVDPSKRPWELDQLMATYAQMFKSRTVAERAVRNASLTTDPENLAARVETETFGYAQLLRVTVTGVSAGEAERMAAAVVSAFAEVRTERGISGNAAVYETSPAVRTDRPASARVDIAIVVFAGLVSAAGIILVFEFLSAGTRTTGGAETATRLTASYETFAEPGGATRPLAGNERA